MPRTITDQGAQSPPPELVGASGHKRRPVKRYVLLIVIAAFMAPCCILDPIQESRFKLDKLRGLTPDEVIGRLGPPRVDPRLPKWGSWKPTKENDDADA